MMEKRIITRRELLESINRSWDKLTKALNHLSEEEMTAIKDPQGWTVKDHIAHITAWERSIIFLLQGKERYQGLGVDEGTYLSRDYDKINHRLFQQTKDLPFEGLIEQFRAIHGFLILFIEALTNGDLQMPYRRYLPDDSKDDDDRLTIDIICGNTANHYDEHLDWIEELVQG
jgi:hypothetical protein